MSMRRAASCCQDLQERVLPRGARIVRVEEGAALTAAPRDGGWTRSGEGRGPDTPRAGGIFRRRAWPPPSLQGTANPPRGLDRKSTRLNSSHQIISYAVFCLKKK